MKHGVLVAIGLVPASGAKSGASFGACSLKPCSDSCKWCAWGRLRADRLAAQPKLAMRCRANLWLFRLMHSTPFFQAPARKSWSGVHTHGSRSTATAHRIADERLLQGDLATSCAPFSFQRQLRAEAWTCSPRLDAARGQMKSLLLGRFRAVPRAQQQAPKQGTQKRYQKEAPEY